MPAAPPTDRGATARRRRRPKGYGNRMGTVDHGSVQDAAVAAVVTGADLQEMVKLRAKITQLQGELELLRYGSFGQAHSNRLAVQSIARQGEGASCVGGEGEERTGARSRQEAERGERDWGIEQSPIVDSGHLEGNKE